MKQCRPASNRKLIGTLATYFRRFIGWPHPNSVCFFGKYKPNSSRRRHVVTFHYTRNEYFEQDLQAHLPPTKTDFPFRTTSDLNTCNVKNTLSNKYGVHLNFKAECPTKLNIFSNLVFYEKYCSWVPRGFGPALSPIQINVYPRSTTQCDCTKLSFQCKQQTQIPNFHRRLCMSEKIYMRPCNTLDNNITPTHERPC